MELNSFDLGFLKGLSEYLSSKLDGRSKELNAIIRKIERIQKEQKDTINDCINKLCELELNKYGIDAFYTIKLTLTNLLE